MFEIFASWEWWQIALTAVFGTMWIVFIVLDQRRKIAAKKLKARRENDLRAQGYSDEQIKEIIQHRIFSSACSSAQKDGEK